MRLLTHNFLCCLECQSYPLQVRCDEAARLPGEFDPAFVRLMLARIDYTFFTAAFNSLRDQKALPDDTAPIPESIDGIDLSDESEELRAIHVAMQEVAVRNGGLICGQCGHEYPVNDFIPDMVIKGK